MKKKVMVVDDSHMIELKICRLLEGSAFEVTAYLLKRLDLEGLSIWHSSSSCSISSFFSS